MDTDIILIGPAGVGKSTVADLLSKKLKLRLVSLDVLRWEYYAEIGYDHEKAQQIRADEGFWSMYQYWKPFELHAVERVLQDYSRCVIEFGAGHSVYEDDALFERARKALAPYKNVILLMPSPDKEESYRILTERYGEEFPINKHFINHHSNEDLAKIIVYSKAQTPEETADEIIKRMTQMDEQNDDQGYGRDTIYFYSTQGEYGCFSNFSAHGFELDGKYWKTSEHYFQAQKFVPHQEHVEAVRLAKTPKQAAEIGRDRKRPLRSDWESVKEDVMRRALIAKFETHDDICQTLLNTGDAKIVENAPGDYYWGIGKNGSGKNRLGILLIQVRDMLREKQS